MKPPQNSGYPKLRWASLVVIHIHVLGGTHAEDTLPDVALQVSVIIAFKNNRSWSTPCLKILVLMTYIPNYSSCLVFWKKYPTLVFWVTYIFQFSKLLPGVVFPTSSWNHTISWREQEADYSLSCSSCTTRFTWSTQAWMSFQVINSLFSACAWAFSFISSSRYLSHSPPKKTTKYNIRKGTFRAIVDDRNEKTQSKVLKNKNR